MYLINATFKIYEGFIRKNILSNIIQYAIVYNNKVCIFALV